MDEKRFLKIICGGAGAVCILFAVIGTSIIVSKNGKIKTLKIDTDAHILKSQQLCKGNKWDEAFKEIDQASQDFENSGFSHRLTEYRDKLEASREDIKKEKSLYAKRVSQGWTVFEGHFISPEDKNRILEERKREQEKIEREKREERDRQFADEQRQKQLALQKKAREMYGNYKKSAETVADNLLKMISATETGINYQKHSEMLQELQFSFNKFSLSIDKSEKMYESFYHLSASVHHFKQAQHWWDKSIDSVREGLVADLEKKYMQEEWAKAMEEYSAAMKSLSKGE